VASICTQCGYEGRAKKTLRGSRGMEIFIWTMLLIPGPLYSVWRRVGLKRRCPNCGKVAMVSPRSHEGKLALQRLELESGVEKTIVPTSRMGETRDAKPPRKPVDPDAW
jgi:hypothetical protein